MMQLKEETSLVPLIFGINFGVKSIALDSVTEIIFGMLALAEVKIIQMFGITVTEPEWYRD